MGELNTKNMQYIEPTDIIEPLDFINSIRNDNGTESIADELYEKYHERIIDASMVCPKPEYLLKGSNGVETLPTKNIHLILAPKKSGKTTFCSIIMSAVINGLPYFGITALQRNCHVLYIDTEQDNYDIIRVLYYVNRLCGNDYNAKNDNITALHCRGLSCIELKDVTRYFVELVKPKLVLLDGIRDYVTDINEPKEVHPLMKELETICTKYNCAILSVLHTNKNDSNARGVLGTEYENKLCDEFLLSKLDEGKGFKAEHSINSRHLTIPELYFKRDAENYGLPVPISVNALGVIETEKEDKEFEFIKDFIIKHNNKQKTGQVKTAYCNRFLIKDRSADGKLKEIEERHKDEIAITKVGNIKYWSVVQPESTKEDIDGNARKHE